MCLHAGGGSCRCIRRACTLSIVNLVAHAGANMDMASKEQNVPEPAPNETHALVYPPEDNGAELEPAQE